MPRTSVIAATTSPASRPAPVDSVRHRYAATLFAQGLQFASSIVAAAVVPRSLGAGAYGNYSFLLNMAGSVRGLTEPSVQQAFFTFSSQEEESGLLTRLYAAWVAAQFVLLLLIVAAVAALGWTDLVWPGQRLDQIVLLTIVDWTAFLALSLKQLGDSKGLTVRPQLFGALAAGISLAVMIGLALSHALTFYTFAWLNLLTAGGTALVLGYWLLVVHGRRCWQVSSGRRPRVYVAQWWAYARPLILVEYYTPLIAVAGAYLIQFWYGSVEQGQLALAARWSTVVLLFTSSAVGIVWREIAAASAIQDHERAGRIYCRARSPLVFVASVVAMWLAFAAPTLVPLFAGPQYATGIRVVAVMAFYPVAQTIGQLSTAGLKAAGRTVDYQKWAMLLSIPDLLLTYALIAPVGARVPGLGLGTFGMALKTTGLALLTVQVYEWALMRHFGLSYGRLLSTHVMTLAVVAVVALVTMAALRSALESALHVNAVMLLTATSSAYFITTAGIAWRWPGLLGSTRSEMIALARLWVQ
jgi:O-antigen/teichoic acid export membrane protein